MPLKILIDAGGSIDVVHVIMKIVSANFAGIIFWGMLMST